MRIKLNFENIEQYIHTIDYTIEEYEDYQELIKTIMNDIVDEGKGAFFISLKEELEIRIKNISKINEYLEELKDKLENFIEDYREYDDSVQSGDYLLDTEELKDKKLEIENFYEKIDYLKNDFEDSQEYEEYQSKVKKYRHNEESDRKLRKIYKEEEETAEYLIKKKDKIEDQLIDEKHNFRIVQEIEDLLKKRGK